MEQLMHEEGNKTVQSILDSKGNNYRHHIK